MFQAKTNTFISAEILSRTASAGVHVLIFPIVSFAQLIAQLNIWWVFKVKVRADLFLVEIGLSWLCLKSTITFIVPDRPARNIIVYWRKFYKPQASNITRPDNMRSQPVEIYVHSMWKILIGIW